MQVKPLANTPDISVCLDYDAQGNVLGVKPRCTGPATDQNEYVTDDFGRTIESRLANVDSSIRYEYNALGNLVRKSIPSGPSNVVPVRRTPSPQLSAAELLIAETDTRHLGSTSS